MGAFALWVTAVVMIGGTMASASSTPAVARQTTAGGQLAPSMVASTISEAWSGWQEISPSGLASPARGTLVTYAPGSNGSQQELFVTTANQQVWMDYELAGGAWSGWHPFSPSGFTGPVTFAPGSNGSLQELFVTSASHQVWMDYELAGGTWSDWHPFSPADATSDEPFLAPYPTAPVTYAPGSNGSVQELFVLGPPSTGTVWMDYELPGGTWSGWHVHKPFSCVTGSLTYAPGSNGSVQELFGPCDGGVVTEYELPGGHWTTWNAIGPSVLGAGPVTFAPGSDGSVQELFVTGSNGEIWMDDELPGGVWSGWQGLSTLADAFGPVTFAPGTNGSLQQLFTVGLQGSVGVDSESAAGVWSSASSPLSPPAFAGGPVTFAPGSNGSLQELFVEGPDAANGWTTRRDRLPERR